MKPRENDYQHAETQTYAACFHDCCVQLSSTLRFKPQVMLSDGEHPEYSELLRQFQQYVLIRATVQCTHTLLSIIQIL